MLDCVAAHKFPSTVIFEANQCVYTGKGFFGIDEWIIGVFTALSIVFRPFHVYRNTEDELIGRK